MNKSSNKVKSKYENYGKKSMATRVGLSMLLALVIFGTTGSHSAFHARTMGDVLSSIVAFAALLGLISLDVSNHRRADEMQQVLRLQAGTISFAAVIATSFAAEILISLHIGNPKQYLQIIFIGGVTLWAITPMVLYFFKQK